MADFDFGSILTGLGNNLVNGVNNYVSNPQLIPALASAYQYMNQADKYGQRGSELKQEANPFGQYRDQYAQRLNSLYADPTQIENTPGYKFRLSQGMGKMSGKAAAQHQGWGNEFADMQNYAQGLASTEYNNEVNRLAKLAGADFGPETSIRAQLDADRNQIEAERAALGAIMTPFGVQPGTTINNGSGGYSGATKLPDGNYKLPSGDIVDMNKLAIAAGQGNPDAIRLMKQITGIDKIGMDAQGGGYEFGGNEPQGPDVSGYTGDGYGSGNTYSLPEDTGGGYGSGDTFSLPEESISLPDLELSLDSWWGE